VDTIAAMPTSPKSKTLAVLLVAAALLAIPASASATLAFVRNPLSPVVYVANDDGSSSKKLAAGSNPHVSPDGESVAFMREGPGHAQELVLAPSSGGKGQTLLQSWRDPFYLAFSPDSTQIAALRGPELGKRKLVLVDVASGAQTVVAAGYFSGFSFSPAGDELAFGRAASESFPQRSDVYRHAILSGKTTRLTSDRKSEDPLWGPTDRIVFVKQVGAKQRKFGPKNELFLMNSNGRGVKRLTHTVVDPLLLGLFPTDWSVDGKRILAEFQGQDTSYAVGVNAISGAQKPVAESGEGGFVGTALSADGATVLGFTGGFEPGPNHRVATVPFTGGKKKVLAKNAFEPDWSL
jgi:Tol biopolymer transport system component